MGRLLDHGASSPSGRGQILGQLCLRHCARHQQPSVIGYDPDFSPASREERVDPRHETFQQLADSPSQADSFMVSGLIKVSIFCPRSSLRIADLSASENLESFVLQKL